MNFKTLFIFLVIALLLFGCIGKFDFGPTSDDKNANKPKDGNAATTQSKTVEAAPLIDLKNPPKSSERESKTSEAPPSLPGK